MNPKTQAIIAKVQVNIPFRMLVETHLDLFIKLGLNPEIGLDADALDHFSRKEFQEIAAAFQRQGRTITLHGPFTDLSPGSPDPEILAVTRRRLEQLSDLVPVFKPLTVVCHAGYDPHRYSYIREEWLAAARTLWQWAGDRIRSAGARLMLENVYESEAEELRPLFGDSALPGIGFCFDAGHQTVFSKKTMAAWLEKLGPFLGQLHLHDNMGDRDAHLPMGKGCIDFPLLFRYLERNHLRPVITLEPHVEGDLWQSLAYLENRWPGFPAE
ncbi:MAG: sugar phosphate isomerase/epimerase family protein [Thermodesulfobacteriota bacterium]